MAHVIVLDSISEDIFVCGVCKSVFNSLQVFLDHKNQKCSNHILATSLLSSAVVQTTLLSDTFSENTTMLQHNVELCDKAANTKSEIISEDLCCVSCKKRFKKSKSLLAHMKMHNDKPYQCSVCGRCFIQNSHLQRHIITHKIWPKGLTETTAKTLEAGLLSYNCSYCNVVLPNYGQYKAHLKSHASFKKFKCIQGDCAEFYDTVDGLLQHVNTSHSTQIYTCHVCSLTFNTLEDIATHQSSHNMIGTEEKNKKVKLYKCSQCDAEFRKSDKLSLHMLTENHKKECIHCGKTFASDKRLRLHLHIHQEYKPFQCSVCKTRFHLKKYLTSHMLKHSVQQYKCSICKCMFKRSDVLHRHMKLHQAKKAFRCPFRESLDCKKEFSRSDKLKLHIKSHTKHVTKITSKLK